MFFPSCLRGFGCFYLLEKCSGNVIILGFDLFDVTEVNLMSQTTARDNVERARDWSLKSLAAMILQPITRYFRVFCCFILSRSLV